MEGAQQVEGIPVRNLWLLMLYASELLRTQGFGRIAVEDQIDELPDLLARLLAETVERRMRRGLSVGHEETSAVLSRVRGRIDVLSTERHHLMPRGLVACRFEELTVDTPRNRFVRGALEFIAWRVSQSKLSHRCRSLASRMREAGVLGEAPTAANPGVSLQGRVDREDALIFSAAKLAYELRLPTESLGTNAHALPDRDLKWLRRLYERAVGGFYEFVLKPLGWSVSRGHSLHWHQTGESPRIHDILPGMRTDIVLEPPDRSRRIVIDTKFTSILKPGWHRAEALSSAYLYQIYAYLQTQAGRGDALADSASGLLLHPATGESVDEFTVIQGHKLRFATVRLDAAPQEIRGQLLHVVDAERKVAVARTGSLPG
jgi:5-methylcytosine-specific restriction enzyme subunit McrC